MPVVVEPNFLKYGTSENACSIDRQPSLDGVRLFAIPLTDGHVD
jgi:hypothetical protein